MQAAIDHLLPEGTVRVPLLGEVAAGKPLEVYSVEDSLDVPENIWNGRRVFALRVRGRSMIEAGIHDGDYLLVEPCEDVDDGRTVVAEVDGCVTVKKVYREADGALRLQPANPEMLPLVVRGGQVRILGAVVGVLRKYGFAGGSGRPRAAETVRRRPRVRQERDNATLELSFNAMDSFLTRWHAAVEGVGAGGTRAEQGCMAEMARDLQALRDWGMRTQKVGLRQAVIAEAASLMQRMENYLAARGWDLPEVTVH